MPGEGLQWAGAECSWRCEFSLLTVDTQLLPICGRSILSAPHPHVSATMTSSMPRGCLSPEVPTSCILLNPQRVRLPSQLQHTDGLT